MLTMRPPPAARMCGSSSRQQRINEKSLTSRSLFQSASVSASNVPGCARPALLTRQSTRPRASAERGTKSRPGGGDGPAPAEPGRGGEHLLLAARADRDRGSFPEQLLRDREPEPLRGSGDDRLAALESEVHSGSAEPIVSSRARLGGWKTSTSRHGPSCVRAPCGTFGGMTTACPRVSSR